MVIFGVVLIVGMTIIGEGDIVHLHITGVFYGQVVVF